MFLTGLRDPDLIILGKLSDGDLLSVRLTNKYANRLCNNEDFWRNRFIEKFGRENMKYKAEKRSWKNFYLLIVKYSNDFILGLKNAVKEGYRDLVDFFLSQTDDVDEDFFMMRSAKAGNQELVNLFIERGARYWTGGLIFAAKGGQREIVDFFIKLGAGNWDHGMANAAKGGHLELVKYFIDKGANMYDLGLRFAAEGGHGELVEFFINKGARNWDSAIWS
jgi:hypothetical protein